MTHTTFVAFASADQFVSNVIGDACKAASSLEADFIPWNRNDVSGQPIDRSVYGWVENSDALVADISEPNHNVTYEVGLALGTQKSLRLIRAANKDRKLLEEIGLLPQQYMHLARMFRDAAVYLPDYVNGGVNWPAYALLLHACELALKGFLRSIRCER